MKIPDYEKRIIVNKDDLYLDTFVAILIEKPKWCGKMRTSLYHTKSKFLFADYKDNFNSQKVQHMHRKLMQKGATYASKNVAKRCNIC